ncbi:MAG TPA: F0F1 ATP synthase subunit B [Desulfosalsimonadaceae bacterium]|nr:F0F1 ATP synthase subunit B [Desulfosalsimonadaceae bacterium]
MKRKSLVSQSRRLVFGLLPVVMILLPALVLASSGGDHGGGGGWEATDTYRVMNFVVLLAILVYLLRKPASQFLSGRIKGIQDQLEDLEAKKKAAEQKLAEYDQRLSRLSEEAEQIVEQYKKQGEAAREKILQEAEASAAKLEEQAKRTIDHEFNQAKKQLETEVLEKAIAKAEEKMKKGITDNDQEKLIDEYLNEVVKK